MQTASLAVDCQPLPARTLRVLRDHRWILLFVVCYLGLALAITWQMGLPDKVSLKVYAVVIWPAIACYVFVFLLLHACHAMIVVRPRQLTRHILNDIWVNYMTTERLLGALLIALALSLFIPVFTTLKTIIPFSNPYAWDPAFTEWEALIHFGRQPWELLHPLLGYPWVTSAINFNYQLWFFVLYCVLCWQAFSTRDPQLRMQFFLTFLLSFSLLGNLMATVLSSTGPVYFGRITGLEDPFAPLMEYLYATSEVLPVWSLQVQEHLWELYLKGDYDLGAGISAMPSMHVSSAVLFALVAWRTHRYLGYGLTIFAVLILLGSVHLGWHYAIDGYVSILGTLALWRISGWAVGRMEGSGARHRAAQPEAAPF